MATSHAAAAPFRDGVALFFFEELAHRNRLLMRRSSGVSADVLYCAGSKPLWHRPIFSAPAGGQT
jgi:hypothetical protein